MPRLSSYSIHITGSSKGDLWTSRTCPELLVNKPHFIVVSSVFEYAGNSVSSGSDEGRVVMSLDPYEGEPIPNFCMNGESISAFCGAGAGVIVCDGMISGSTLNPFAARFVVILGSFVAALVKLIPTISIVAAVPIRVLPGIEVSLSWVLLAALISGVCTGSLLTLRYVSMALFSISIFSSCVSLSPFGLSLINVSRTISAYFCGSSNRVNSPILPVAFSTA